MFECKACKIQEQRIGDLKMENSRLSEALKNERAEYKRAVDALLVTREMPAIGQGASNAPMDPTKFFRMFDEEVPEKKDK